MFSFLAVITETIRFHDEVENKGEIDFKILLPLQKMLNIPLEIFFLLYFILFYFHLAWSF